jgi:hypothetical protein
MVVRGYPQKLCEGEHGGAQKAGTPSGSSLELGTMWHLQIAGRAHREPVQQEVVQVLARLLFPLWPGMTKRFVKACGGTSDLREY